MTPLCPRSNDPPMFVSDLIHAATRPWNMEVVREHMYEMDAEAVANIPISHVAQPERMEEDFSYHIRTDFTGSVSHSKILTVSLAVGARTDLKQARSGMLVVTTAGIREVCARGGREERQLHAISHKGCRLR